MPRPGQRPYECVRRAWHSDRHNPVRGSLIQEIFRIANEVHSPSTRKNREWQEKLPIVVLRAEEILYSKANSEAEYTDLTTLWDRVNDAIDTIIRKDESTETGALLQPCIEAALHLGCTPRRSSRSQRNDSPRCYLRPMPSNLDAKAFNMFPSSSSSCPSLRTSQSSHLRAANYSIMQSRNCSVPTKNFLGPWKEFRSSCKELRVMEPSSSSWSVYPLYYDNGTKLDGPKLYSSRPRPSTLPYSRQNGEAVARQNFHSSQVSLCSSPPNKEHILGIGHELKCDLTLRLGPGVHSCARIEDSLSPKVKQSTLQIRRTSKSVDEIGAKGAVFEWF